jgi:hypothetical protein
MEGGSLEKAWKGGREGCLCPLEQLKAFAFRQAFAAVGRIPSAGQGGIYADIARRLTKNGGGEPSRDAVRKLLEGIERGPRPLLDGAKRRCIAKSAMAAKSNGEEPTCPLIAARCPKAVLNPATGLPVDKKLVSQVFKEDGFDHAPEEPWEYEARLSRTAFPDPVMALRLAWAHGVIASGRNAGYYYRHVTWVDLRHSILPRTQKKAAEQALARKGRKGWVSKDAKGWSRNLQGPAACLQQNSWGTLKLWWGAVLARGKLHVVCFTVDFPGEKPEGAAILAEKLGFALRQRFPNDPLPALVMCDRGKGFFQTQTAAIAEEWKKGLHDAGLKPLQGDNAASQPGSLADCMLHETAVSWLRKLLRKSAPPTPWTETPDEYYHRLRKQCDWAGPTAGFVLCVLRARLLAPPAPARRPAEVSPEEHVPPRTRPPRAGEEVNKRHDVAGLCRALPERVAAVVANGGGAIGK